MRIGYTGDVAIDIEELAALVSDLSVSSVVVIILTLAVVLLFFRWWKSVFVLLVPLTLAALYAFALVTLPPIGIDGLNSNTAFLGSVIVGNGVNFGIILLARYVEERRAGQSIEESLVIAIWGSRAGTVVAALGGGYGLRLAHAHAIPRLPSVRRDRRGGHDRLLERWLSCSVRRSWPGSNRDASSRRAVVRIGP